MAALGPSERHCGGRRGQSVYRHTNNAHSEMLNIWESWNFRGQWGGPDGTAALRLLSLYYPGASLWTLRATYSSQLRPDSEGVSRVEPWHHQVGQWYFYAHTNTIISCRAGCN
jgi:hypothetical protein